MQKPSKQAIIDAIIKGIEDGQTRGKLLGIIGKKWEISRTTFDRYWKIANQQHQELQQKAKEAADRAYIQSSEEAAKGTVMSKAERQKILSGIARGEVTQMVSGKEPGEVVEVPVVVEITERLKAIAEINKMEGDYAPTKVANTDSKGNDVKQFDLTKLSDNELRTLAELQRKGGAGTA